MLVRLLFALLLAPVRPVWSLLTRSSAGRATSHVTGMGDSLACDPKRYGREGKWVDSKSEWSFVWEDKHCGILPAFDKKTFCQESLKCKSMLFVGDSTSSMHYFMTWELLHWEKGLKKFSGDSIHPDGSLIAGVTKEDFSNDCGAPHHNGEPNTRSICESECKDPVNITLIRHDHLNGYKFPDVPNFHSTRTACHWKPALASHPWVVMSTGTHVNDDMKLLQNQGGVWEKTADSLFSFLAKAHPRGLIWRTAHTGYYNKSGCGGAGYPCHRTAGNCPMPELIRNSPLPEHEIDGELFRGSWRKIPAINKVYKDSLFQHLPNAVLMDAEPLMSMRPDCRVDPIHYDWHQKATPLHMWARMLQAFLINETP